MERDAVKSPELSMYSISIHSLSWRETKLVWYVQLMNYNFNPLSRIERDLLLSLTCHTGYDFNPLSRMERDPDNF